MRTAIVENCKFNPCRNCRWTTHRSIWVQKAEMPRYSFRKNRFYNNNLFFFSFFFFFCGKRLQTMAIKSRMTMYVVSHVHFFFFFFFHFCFTALQRLLGSLPVLSAHSFASNWQLLSLNQRKRENDRRNVFMTKSSRKNVPDVGIELGAACMPSEHASDRATAAPGHVQGECLSVKIKIWLFKCMEACC